MVTRHSPLIRILLPALAMLGVAAVALAADGPRRGPARPGPVMASEAIKAPAVDAAKSYVPLQKVLVTRRMAATAEDKGSLYTDMGDPSAPAQLNEIEKAKLDMARAAVALSRSAGTLYRPLPVEGMSMSREQAEAIKLEAARTRTVAVPNSPAAGFSNVPPVQLVGPEGLSELEQAKLEAVKAGRPVPTPQSVAKPSRRSGSRDDGAAKATKGGR